MGIGNSIGDIILKFVQKKSLGFSKITSTKGEVFSKKNCQIIFLPLRRELEVPLKKGLYIFEIWELPCINIIKTQIRTTE